MAVGFDSVKSVKPRSLADSWEALVDVLSVHVERDAKQNGNLWSPVTYHEGSTRGLAGVDKVEAFVLDLDDVGLDAVRERLNGLAYVAYSTWSFCGTSGVHVVVPLAEAVDVWEWESVWDACFDFFGRVGDSVCRDASRIFYRPQHASGAPHFVEVGEGDRLDLSKLNVTRPRYATQQRRTSRPTQRRRGGEPAFLSEAWWNEPADLSRFEGKSEREALEMFYDEWQVIKAKMKADGLLE